MKKTKQHMDALSIFIFDSVCVLEELIKVEIFIFRICDDGNTSFNAEEISRLREVLRLTLGKHVDRLSCEDLSEFGASMLQATAIVLKARYLRSKTQIKIQNIN